ncbi:S-adenosyl-L-methionine-dependent methyltransferase [Diaporthe amygdali]|uniref:S-adenosyl-L-methionine-dependent methyltransferase n=1 Tax=Phomopsis amygdali TaxID=1214568 RepID=UPI0022FDC052|nr:S-adenosyl-L-methionine-dependent methyltransferase [Diaporthe amygdali]KAJ0118710.1 S-adenosyl-L-methionine-dependent methyltransferase [Diaporthe amygdali]
MDTKPHNVVEVLDSISGQSFDTNADRYEAKEAARRLLARIETPFERSWALSFETPVLIAGLQICQDLGIWSTWAAKHDNNEDIQTLDGVIDMCNVPVQPNLLRRFLRHLAATNVLEETGVDTWKLSPFAKAIGKDTTNIGLSVQCGLDHTIPCGVNLAGFLAKHRYQEPLDKAKFDNYTDLFGSDFFDLCQRNPSVGGSFIGLMTALANHKMDWTEVYNTAGLVQGADLSSSGPALFVDIGGAHGLDTARFLAKHPNLPASAKLVVQDLPEVVSTHAKTALSPRIERMAYDFFQPQPLLGARTYFLHAVPHDWPDGECKRIFQNIKTAMLKGYSKLLIYEVVLPNKGATSLMTTLDLQLMNLTSGFERTERGWEKLLGEVGFGILQIFRHPGAVESVIEVELL